ncbi:MAG: hypothetical protein LBS21_07555 [Clostridiales bacterium]|jgi:hypothetical protein|nr:hypothetical protein [Clostridiales bacterium]
MPKNGQQFHIGDEVEVKARIKNVSVANLNVGSSAFEHKFLLDLFNDVTFSRFKLTEEHLGLLPIEVQAHIGGTSIQANSNVKTNSIEIKVEVAQSAETDDYFAIIISETLSVRAERSTSSESLLSLAPGDHVKIVLPKNRVFDGERTWIEAYYKVGETGWIDEAFIHPNVPIITDFPESQYTSIIGSFDGVDTTLYPIDNWGIPGGGDYEGEAKKDSQGRYLVCVGPSVTYH